MYRLHVFDGVSVLVFVALLLSRARCHVIAATSIIALSPSLVNMYKTNCDKPGLVNGLGSAMQRAYTSDNVPIHLSYHRRDHMCSFSPIISASSTSFASSVASDASPSSASE